jgi:hypothetical protein
VDYAVLVLGSAGRGESLLAADQDNAIVYASGEPGGAEDQWFEALGIEIASILDAAGVPFCKGGVMARNAQWRMSVARWRSTIDGWVRRQRPQDLLNVDIFFDCVPVHGALALGEGIWNYAYEVGHGNPAFVKLLSELARDWRAPVTLFGNIRTDMKGRTDLKKGGLLPLFTAGESGTPASTSASCWRRIAPSRTRCASTIASISAGEPTPAAATPRKRSTVARARTSWRIESARAAVTSGSRPPFFRSVRPPFVSLRMFPNRVRGARQSRASSLSSLTKAGFCRPAP